LFTAIQGINKKKKAEAAKPEAPSAPTASEKLLTEIGASRMLFLPA
jgi:hypothetical protein